MVSEPDALGPTAGRPRIEGIPGPLLIGAALGTQLFATLIDTSRVSGHDLAVAGAALLPLLLAGLSGALAAGFLIRRHPGLAEHLFACCALLSGLVLAFATPGRAELLELAARIHGPDVTRTHYLAGVALTAAIVGGAGTLLLSGAGAGALRPTSKRRGGLWLLAGLLAGLCLPIKEPWLSGAAICALAVLLGRCLHAWRLLGLLLLLAILLAAPRRAPAWQTPWLLLDPVRQATGAEAGRDPSRGIDGRDWRAPEIPGWPYEGAPLEPVFQLMRSLSGSGPLVLLGAEAAALKAPARDHPGDLRCGAGELRPHEDPGGILLLPSLFAHPWPALPGALFALGDLRDRLAPGRPLAVCLDLSELTFEEVALAAALIQAPGFAPVTLHHGTHCLFVALREPGDAELAFARGKTFGLWPLLTAGATLELIRDAGGASGAPVLNLQLRRARTRLGSRQFRQAAVNLHRLGRRADAPGFQSRQPAPFGLGGRLRTELAVAILQDDTLTEERLLFQLGQLEPELAGRLRLSRMEARARLQEELRSWLSDTPDDADLHHRLGRILVRGGDVLEGIEHLNRTVRLRPKQVDAAVDLGRAYLQAEEQNLRRKTPTGPIDGCRYLYYGLPRYLRGLEEAYDRARLNEAYGRASLCLARREPEGSPAHTDWLRRAQAQFRLAAELDPLCAGAYRGLARVLALSDRREQALDNALLSIRLDPFEPEGYRLLAELSDDAEEVRAALDAAERLAGP